MARVQTDGLDDLIEKMDKLGKTSGDLADRMLFAGAEEVKKAWRKAAKAYGLIDTGEMHDSIGYSRTPKVINNIKSIDIYPQGFSRYTTKADGSRVLRRKKIRNAEKAFVLHYGTSRKPATHWVDTADDMAGPMVGERLLAIFDEWLKKHGFL